MRRSAQARGQRKEKRSARAPAKRSTKCRVPASRVLRVPEQCTTRRMRPRGQARRHASPRRPWEADKLAQPHTAQKNAQRPRRRPCGAPTTSDLPSHRNVQSGSLRGCRGARVARHQRGGQEAEARFNCSLARLGKSRQSLANIFGLWLCSVEWRRAMTELQRRRHEARALTRAPRCQGVTSDSTRKEKENAKVDEAQRLPRTPCALPTQ